MKRPNPQPNPMASTIEVLLKKNAKLVKALEDIIGLDESYEACRIAREAIAENEK